MMLSDRAQERKTDPDAFSHLSSQQKNLAKQVTQLDCITDFSKTLRIPFAMEYRQPLVGAETDQSLQHRYGRNCPRVQSHQPLI